MASNLHPSARLMIARSSIAALGVWAVMLAPVQAQDVTLQFSDGHVTLIAQNAPLRSILAAWASEGGSTIVNADRVVGEPLTLELRDMPEKQALEILLRSVSGYMIAARQPDASGASAFDRILILPTSTGPRNPPPVTPMISRQPRPVVPRPRVVPEGLENQLEPDFPYFDGSEQPLVPDGEPLMPDGEPLVPDGEVDMPGFRPDVPQPFVLPGQETGDGQAPPPGDGSAPTPNNPFGLPFGATSRPGIVTPVPQAPNPNSRPDPTP